ncbi:MAG: GH3 auxin-responsive promoter family protein, partial [Anaerotruncus massiliensis (ex Togo et al. 2019)]
YITTSFTAGGGRSKKNLFQYSPAMVCRYLAASYRAKRDGRTVQPKDIFRLKALICAGTDTSYYKPSLEEAWGVRPMEIYAGTEPTLMATETWARNGLVFFPDNCFYEFIPEGEMYKNLDDRTYQPKTCLMDELTASQNYEVVIRCSGRIRPYRVGTSSGASARRRGGPPAALPRGPDPHRHRHRRLHPHHRDTISDVVRLSGWASTTGRRARSTARTTALPAPLPDRLRYSR